MILACPLPHHVLLRACVYPPSGVVLHFWVGLGSLPLVDPAAQILSVETAIKEFVRANFTEIGSCCFSSWLLAYAVTSLPRLLHLNQKKLQMAGIRYIAL